MVRADYQGKARKVIQEMNFLVYIIICLAGICMLIFAYNRGRSISSDSVFFYDLLMGIGGGLVSSALSTIFLLAILPSESNENNKYLQELGVVDILLKRDDFKIDLQEMPKERLDIITFRLTCFGNPNEDMKSIASRIEKEGILINIITLNPYSIYISYMERIENSSRNLKSDILNLKKWVNNVNSHISLERYKIQIKYYDDIPLDFYCRCDSLIYAGPYIPSPANNDMQITYIYRVDSEGGQYYNTLFKAIWTGATSINLSKQPKQHIRLSESNGIEAIMRYFCSRMNVETSMVIGVIAIFKDNLRRTFFSCNKKHKELYPVHRRDEGAVGILQKVINESRESEPKVAIFSDYNNKITYMKFWRDRSSEIIILDENPIKMKNNKDTVAVLAIPIFKEIKARIETNRNIGVLSFDFAELPENYNDRVKSYKELRSPYTIRERISITDTHLDCSELEDMFENAKQCKDIVSNFLGQILDGRFKKLYEEEWILCKNL